MVVSEAAILSRALPHRDPQPHIGGLLVVKTWGNDGGYWRLVNLSQAIATHPTV